MAFTHLLAEASDLKDGAVVLGLEGEVNAVLVALLNRNIVGVEIVAKDKARRQGRELDVQVSHDDVGTAVLANPFRLVTFLASTLDEVSALGAAFRALQPGWFYAVPFIRYFQEFATANKPFILFQFYCQDPNGEMNWLVNNAGMSPAGGADTQVQYNDGGIFNGDARFTFDKVTGTLTFTGIATVNRPTNRIDIQGDRSTSDPHGMGPYANGVVPANSVGYGHRISVDMFAVGAPATTVNVCVGWNNRVSADNNQQTPNVCIGTGILLNRGSGTIIVGNAIRTEVNCKNSVIISWAPSITLDGGGAVYIGRIAASAAGGSVRSVAIGWDVRVQQRCVAIGNTVNAGHNDSVAFGTNAVTTATLQIMLGTASYRVDIPGKANVNNIQTTGMIQYLVTRTAANATLTRTVNYVLQTAAGIATLLWAAPQQGDWIAIRNAGGGAANTVGGNGNTIEGAASINLLDGESVVLIWDHVGLNWVIY